MLCVDRQMGLNIVHPEGKVSKAVPMLSNWLTISCQAAKTVFNRMFYDENSNTSVVHCKLYQIPYSIGLLTMGSCQKANH